MHKIKIKNLRKSYGEKEVLHNMNLEVDSGKIIALVGKNGSGKTTLLKCMAQVIEDYSGEIIFDGQDKYDNVKDIFLIPDKIILPQKMEIGNIINIFKKRSKDFDEVYANDFLEFLDITPNQVMGQLSKGNQEIIQIGIFIACKPKFLLMDEPLAAVDIIKRNFLYEKIIDLNSDGVGILLSSHILTEIQNIFSEIIVLKDSGIKEVKTVEEIYEQGYESVNDYISEVLN